MFSLIETFSNDYSDDKLLIKKKNILFHYSDTALPGFSYCGDNGLNFSTNSANYSEDDADFAPGRRNKPSRVSVSKMIIANSWLSHSIFLISF